MDASTVEGATFTMDERTGGHVRIIQGTVVDLESYKAAEV